MNTTIKPLAAAALAMCMYAGTGSASDTMELKSDTAKTSYALGYQIGGDMKRQQVDIDSVAVVQGIVDARKGDTPRMSEETMRNTLMELKRKIVAQERAEAKVEIDQAAEAAKKSATPEHHGAQDAPTAKDAPATAPAVKDASVAKDTPAAQAVAKRMSPQGEEIAKEFFANNAKKEGIVTLPSGVQYKVLQEGSGKQPKDGDKVSMTYRGTLANGTEFGNSNAAARTFPLNALVPGLREAVSRMKEGAEWQVFIPPQLGFDARTPLFRKITVFDIKLASVKSE